MSDDFDVQDMEHLKSIEHAPFYPIGQLYRSVMEGLVERGLAKRVQFDGYVISERGAKVLAVHRNAVILGLDPVVCDGVYPRTSDGRCQGCGTTDEIHPTRSPR